MEIWAPTCNSVTGAHFAEICFFLQKMGQNVPCFSMKNRKTTDVVQRWSTMCSGGQYLHSKYGARHWKSDLEYAAPCCGLGFLWRKRGSRPLGIPMINGKELKVSSIKALHNPCATPMEYLPTCTINLSQS